MRYTWGLWQGRLSDVIKTKTQEVRNKVPSFPTFERKNEATLAVWFSFTSYYPEFSCIE